jgi:hypothetical protein
LYREQTTQEIPKMAQPQGKIQTAILTRSRLGHQVWVLADGRVSVQGAQAVQQALKLADAGLIRFHNNSERTRIGTRLDGSWKYGMILGGICEII